MVWTLATLRKRYDEFNRHVEGLLKDIDDKKRDDREGLFFRGIDLQGEFMEIILDEDPCLPKELLPSDDWPGLSAHDSLHRLARVLATMQPMSAVYGYLFHQVPGMEKLIEYHRDGELDFFRTDE
jgi:DNA-binding transcriptional regulator PaaX